MTKKAEVSKYFLDNAFKYNGISDFNRNGYVISLENKAGRSCSVYSNGMISTRLVFGRSFNKQCLTAKEVRDFLKRNGYLK